MIFFLKDEDHHWLYFVYSVLVFWRSMAKVVDDGVIFDDTVDDSGIASDEIIYVMYIV